jgi:hypothetical protein
MVSVFPQIFVLGFMMVYVALLLGLIWWSWQSRARSQRRPTLVSRLKLRRLINGKNQM